MRYWTFHKYLQALVEIGRVTTDNARVADALLTGVEAMARISVEKGQERLPLQSLRAEAIANPAIEDAHTDLDRTLLKERLKRIEQITQVRTEDIPRVEQNAV